MRDLLNIHALFILSDSSWDDQVLYHLLLIMLIKSVDMFSIYKSILLLLILVLTFSTASGLVDDEHADVIASESASHAEVQEDGGGLDNVTHVDGFSYNNSGMYSRYWVMFYSPPFQYKNWRDNYELLAELLWIVLRGLEFGQPSLLACQIPDKPPS